MGQQRERQICTGEHTGQHNSNLIAVEFFSRYGSSLQEKEANNLLCRYFTRSRTRVSNGAKLGRGGKGEEERVEEVNSITDRHRSEPPFKYQLQATEKDKATSEGPGQQTLQFTEQRMFYLLLLGAINSLKNAC